MARCYSVGNRSAGRVYSNTKIEREDDYNPVCETIVGHEKATPLEIKLRYLKSSVSDVYLGIKNGSMEISSFTNKEYLRELRNQLTIIVDGESEKSSDAPTTEKVEDSGPEIKFDFGG